MKHAYIRLFVTLLAASLTLALAACGQASSDTSAPEQTPTLSITTTFTGEESTSSIVATIPSAVEPHPKEPTPIEPAVIEGFVKVADIDNTIVIDLRYATTDNFTGQQVYPTDTCVLRIGAAEKLAEANAAVSALGYRIKVWDAYRPFSVQEIFWEIYPDSRYVANPATGGSIHNRGCAVDVTLVDGNGDELVMPSEFDDFSSKASPSDPGMSAEARANLDVLRQAMLEAGFRASTTEWWHFSDTAYQSYPVADVDLSLF